MVKYFVISLIFVLLVNPVLSDDGQWEVVYTFPQWFVILDVACSTPWDVWVSGINEQTDTSQIYYSADGGISWTMQYSGTDLGAFLLGMDAPADGSTAFIAGVYIMLMPSDGTGAVTTNGGTTWSPIPPADDFVSSFRSVTSLSATETYLVGGWGFSDIKGLYATFDGGSNWEQFCEIPAAHPLQFADFIGEQDIWVTGGVWPEEESRPDVYSGILVPHRQAFTEEASDEYGERSTDTDEEFEASIWYSGNGGAGWTEQFSSVGIGCMSGIDMISENIGIAVGGGPDFCAQIYRTTDGGSNWVSVNFSSQNEHILSDIEMVSATEGWAVGYDPNGPGSQPGTAIIGTTDGGLTWTRESINEATALLGVDMYDEHRGFTAGGNNLKISRVIRYDDGYYSQGLEGGTNVNPALSTLGTPVPNPATSTTTVTLNLAGHQRVNLAVYDINGQQVAILADDILSGGTHDFMWTGVDDLGRPVPGGVYFVQYSGDNTFESVKLIMLR
ncbi:MAG: T9SS type A sorting domain-containing protein [FCB group bacterium]|nr:T9SS type A sorting domain-containing protein [FCB group bacterium]